MLFEEKGRIRPGYPLVHCAYAWERHRFWKRTALALFLGWIPWASLVVTLAGAFARSHHHEPPAWIPIGLFVMYAISWLVVSNIAAAFRCPRCGARFYAWGPCGLGHNGFARKCRNCGLRKWECPPAAEPVSPRSTPRVPRRVGVR